MDELEKNQTRLQDTAKRLVTETKLIELLEKLGTPIQTGSSMTGLMVYPDIDFTILNSKPDIQTAIDLIPALFNDLRASEVKVADFRSDSQESAAYYVGVSFPFNGESWHIDATVSDDVNGNDPSSAYKYLLDINSKQRITILRLKKDLIDTKRYAGARSQPPYTFRSFHLYEGVIRGEVQSIEDLENYFSKN